MSPKVIERWHYHRGPEEKTGMVVGGEGRGGERRASWEPNVWHGSWESSD